MSISYKHRQALKLPSLAMQKWPATICFQIQNSKLRLSKQKTCQSRQPGWAIVNHSQIAGGSAKTNFVYTALLFVLTFVSFMISGPSFCVWLWECDTWTGLSHDLSDQPDRDQGAPSARSPYGEADHTKCTVSPRDSRRHIDACQGSIRQPIEISFPL